METVQSFTFDNGYRDSLDLLLRHGEKVSPRGLNTIELSPFTFTLKDPRTRLIQNPERKINLGLNLVEYLVIIGADDNVEPFTQLAPNMIRFSDDGRVFRGAYGPRLRKYKGDQFKKVIDNLKSDSSSRQAIMTIYDPALDYTITKDVPCTVNFHFLLRNDKLRMNVYMRSNDAMLGHPIDIFNFTMIQETIATELGVDVGDYNHMVGSFHLYESDIEKAEKIISNVNYPEVKMNRMEGGLAWAEKTYENLFKNKQKWALNDYWIQIEKAIEAQLNIKNKKEVEINFTDNSFKNYFERKLWERK